jgi:hypothetical protein
MTMKIIRFAVSEFSSLWLPGSGLVVGAALCFRWLDAD